MLRSSIHNADYSSVIARQPGGRRGRPTRYIGAPDEIDFATRKHFVNTTKPSMINLFVVIDHAHKFAMSRVDTGIQSVRPTLLFLKYVTKMPAKFRHVAVNRVTSGISAVVIHDRYRHD
jgi:hypothetical protein